MGLPSYQLSRLINETFGRSFTDFVNEHRVREFVRRANAPEFASHSIYGIALDVGFNSKSSFNTAFKKFTGKTPSEVRKKP
jgi:AraC-like DNA-binding protein